MYRLFIEKFPAIKVSLTTFTTIFNTKFNLSFYRPKKDQCDKCCLYMNLHNSSRLSEDEKALYKKHIDENRNCKIDRDRDRQITSKNTAFNLPKGFSSIFYYKRKLSVFNMTAIVCAQNSNEKNVTYCAI